MVRAFDGNFCFFRDLRKGRFDNLLDGPWTGSLWLLLGLHVGPSIVEDWHPILTVSGGLIQGITESGEENAVRNSYKRCMWLFLEVITTFCANLLAIF